MRLQVQEFIKTAKATSLAEYEKLVLDGLVLAEKSQNSIYTQHKRIDLTRGDIEQVQLAIATLESVCNQIQGVRAVLHNFKYLDCSPLRTAGNASFGTHYMLKELLYQQSGLSSNYEKINAVRAL